MANLSFFNAGPSTSMWERPKTADGTLSPKPKRPTASRNVSFQSGPRPGEDEPSELPTPTPLTWKKETRTKKWQRLDRHAQNVDPNINPISPAPSRITQPFAIYSDEFSSIVGENPSLDLVITDPRAPYFYSGGAWVPRLRTLFLTSSLIRDKEPSAISSANKRTEITKIELFGRQDFGRDKVRCPEHSYMAAGCALYPNGDSNGIVTCAQGSLSEPSGLVFIDTKRPHKTHMLLNNFYGRPFNSPCDIVSNPFDGSLYFIDPAYGYERGFRPKPQLPTGNVYRFDIDTGACRVVANGLSRPAGLALSPDYSVLYVSELGDKYGGTTIHAFDIIHPTPLQNSLPFSISVSRGAPNGVTGVNGTHKSSNSSSTQSSNGASHLHSHSNSYKLMPTSPQVQPADVPSGRNSSRSYSRSASRGPSEVIPSPTFAKALPVSIGPPHFTSASGPFLCNKRLFAYSPTPGSSGGISTDPTYGYVCLGTEEGVEVWSRGSGEMIGKILVDDEGAEGHNHGVSKVAFTGDGELWLFGGERVWRARVGKGIEERFWI
ncbi:MAG: hypothetical protein Q9227_009167 [Pyrenula ochraceoflavens]